MSIQFAGTSIIDFSGTLSVRESGSYVVDTADEGVLVDPGNEASTPIFSGLTDVWVSMNLRCYSYSNSPILNLYDSSGGHWFRVKRSSSSSQSTYQIEAWDNSSSSWVVLVTSSTATSGTVLHRLDIHVKIDSTVGEAHIYLNRVLDGSFVGNTQLGSGNPIAQAKFSSMSNSWYTVFSGIIIADEDTSSKVFIQGELSGDGTNSDWIGTYSNLNGTGESTGGVIVGSAAEQISTFLNSGIPSPYDVGYTVDAVVLSSRGKQGSAFDTIGAVRSSGVNYEMASFDFGETYSKGQVYLPTNPATGVAWTPGEVDLAEFGVKLKNA